MNARDIEKYKVENHEMEMKGECRERVNSTVQ